MRSSAPWRSDRSTRSPAARIAGSSPMPTGTAPSHHDFHRSGRARRAGYQLADGKMTLRVQRQRPRHWHVRRRFGDFRFGSRVGARVRREDDRLPSELRKILGESKRALDAAAPARGRVMKCHEQHTLHLEEDARTWVTRCGSHDSRPASRGRAMPERRVGTPGLVTMENIVVSRHRHTMCEAVHCPEHTVVH